MENVITYVGIALLAAGIIASLAGGAALWVRMRFTRLFHTIEGGPYPAPEATSKAVKLLRIQISSRDSPFDQHELVLAQAPIWFRRNLRLALCLFGLSVLFMIIGATAIIENEGVNIDHGFRKILYDLVIAVVFGFLTGVVTGLVVDQMIKSREDARWLSVRRLYYVSISRILNRLLNEAVPNALKTGGGRLAGSGPKSITDFEPEPRDFFYEFATWHPIIKNLLGQVSPTKPLNSEPLLLIDPLRKAIEALEKLFQTYGPIENPALRKLIGTIVTKSIQFNDFASSTADWKSSDNINDYYKQVVLLLRLSYELSEKIKATGEVTAGRPENQRRDRSAR